MKRWGYALISIGCIFIASSPIMGNKALMITSGLLTVGIGLWIALQKGGKDK